MWDGGSIWWVWRIAAKHRGLVGMEESRRAQWSPPPHKLVQQLTEQHIKPTATAQKHHENGSGDPNRAPDTITSLTPSVQFIEGGWGWWDLGHIYILGSEQQWRASQHTAKFNYWKFKQNKFSPEITHALNSN